MAKIEKILTDVPYLDEIIYYTKILAINTVLKNETEANNAETLQSAQASALYLACMDNFVLFDQITFTLQMLQKSTIPPEMYDACLLDSNNIPVDKRPELISIAKEVIIAQYEEYNNYYRMLNGLPNVGDLGIKVTNWTPPEGLIIDLNKYVHMMTKDEIQILDNYGVLDKLIEDNPTMTYLRHLGDKRVDYYKARKANRFEALYTPIIDSVEIYDKYRARLEINRVFTLKTIYSEAFKYGSDYYDNFISVLIVIQTMLDLISSIQEFIARREVFDLRSIQYIFQSYGMPFYPEIPTRYQIAMMRNLNKLIKYKSTTKNMVDICSLFGFDNIEIFKYHLLKSRKMTDDGKFQFIYKEIEDPDNPGQTIKVEDVEAEYDLKFIRVPLEEHADDYLKDPNNYVNYDDVTQADATWDGDLSHEYVKSQILQQEFNHVRSKYISIDTVYEITKMSFEIPYFFNILFDDIKLEENLTLFIPSLSANDRFRLTDVFCYLFALTYEFNGIEDSIMDTTGKVLHVNGFNFKANMAELASYVQEKGFTMEELGVAGFMKPTTSLISYNQLIEIFVKNGNIRDHLIKQMRNADNKRIYDIYKYLYDALMITEFNTDYFKDPDTGAMPATYTEYLQRRNTTLYLSLIDVKAINDKDVKAQRISTIVNNVIYALDEYIDSDTFRYIYSSLPSVSGEHIKQYIVKVINFFKSYKIDMLGINTVYKFDDKLDNMIRAIDDLWINSVFNKDEYLHIFDRLSKSANTTKEERYKILERLYFDISTWVYKNFANYDTSFKEDLIMLIATRDVFDKMEMEDHIHKNSVFDKDDYAYIFEKFGVNVDSIKEERYKILERLYFDISTWVYKNFDSLDVGIKNEIVKFLIAKNIGESISDDIREELNMKITSIFTTIANINDSISNLNTVLDKLDNVELKDYLMKQINIIASTNAILKDTVGMSLYMDLTERINQFDHCFNISKSVKSDKIGVEEHLYISNYIA